MPLRQRIGPVRPLDHEGCDQECRDLCFDTFDPEGRRVRLAHGAWRRVLTKENRQLMASYLHALPSAISAPSAIHVDPLDKKSLLYYGELDEGRIAFLPVKCLPRRFQDGEDQRRLEARGRLLGRPWGEAWVSSAYLVREFKPRGIPLWPSS